MLYHILVPLADQFGALNVFRYLTFRTGGAVITALIVSCLFGPVIIEMLKSRQQGGQPIREDGPESHFLKPKGMWGLNFKYINLSQNVSLNGDYINPALDLEINSFPITAFHTFAIKGQHAEVVAMINPTSISSNSSFPLLGISNEDCKSGFSDGFVGLKVGMINSKAVSFEEFVAKKPEFLMMSYFRVWFSGS